MIGPNASIVAAAPENDAVARLQLPIWHKATFQFMNIDCGVIQALSGLGMISGRSSNLLGESSRANSRPDLPQEK